MGSISNFGSQSVGKMNEGSKDLTLKDIIDYKSSSYIGKIFTKISLAAQGKGWIDSSSIARVVDNLGQGKLKELVTVLENHNSPAIKEMRKMLEGRITLSDEGSTTEDVTKFLMGGNDKNVEAFSDKDVEEFMNNPYEQLQNESEHLENFMGHLLQMEQYGETDESVKDLVDFAKLKEIVSEDMDLTQNIGSVIKPKDIPKFSELFESFVDSGGVLAADEISKLELPDDDQLEQMRQFAEVEETKIQQDANRPERGQELNRLVTVLTSGFNEITEKKWDNLEDNASFNENLTILGYQDASSLREVLTSGNTGFQAVQAKRDFSTQLIKDIESTLIGNDEGAKQAAKSILNEIFGSSRDIAGQILNLRREPAAEPIQSRSRAASQEMVEEIEQPRVEVAVANPAVMTRLAERLRDSIVKTLQTSDSSEPFENLDYEISSLQFEPRRGTGVIYEANDLLSLSDDDPESFEDFVAFATHLNTLLKSEDAVERETAESIISGLGGYQLLSDMQNM